jgi:F-type H+-transporting ATPase subunit delta
MSVPAIPARRAVNSPPCEDPAQQQASAHLPDTSSLTLPARRRMATRDKQSQLLARQLAQLSLADGTVSAERVAGVLDYLEKHPPAHPLQVLKHYQRLIAIEVAKSRAVVEHAGALGTDALRSIEQAMSRRYGRPVTATAHRNDALIAGLRIRVADDVYESSIAGQLATLAETV